MIFDFDGVIVKSEEPVFKAWQEELRTMHKDLDETDFKAMIGLDAEAAARYVLNTTGLDVDPADLAKKVWDRATVILENELEPVPGLVELIAKLKVAGCNLGIASNSTSDYVHRTLKLVHLEGVFQTVVTRDDVPTGKPAPDVYLEAARRLAVPPQECLAIEDSPVGMQAALSAGMRCAVLCPEDDPEPDFARATGIYASIADLCRKVEPLLASN